VARIKGWGELNYSQKNKELMEDYEFDGEFGIEMNIRLDDPIEIPAESRVEGMSNWIRSESNVDIVDGNVRRNDMFSSFVSEEMVRVFAGQKTYKSVTLYLDNSDRDSKGDSPLCDLSISIGLKKKLENPDRFLQSFARKLNKWLAAGKIKWEWLRNSPDSECGANYTAGIGCLDDCGYGGEHDFPYDPRVSGRQPNEFLGFMPNLKDLQAGIACKKCGRNLEVHS
jgi:hypothetical protein